MRHDGIEKTPLVTILQISNLNMEQANPIRMKKIIISLLIFIFNSNIVPIG